MLELVPLSKKALVDDFRGNRSCQREIATADCLCQAEDVGSRCPVFTDKQLFTRLESKYVVQSSGNEGVVEMNDHRCHLQESIIKADTDRH